jgi:threonine/homoserine/homoserine lactone efflux protein
MKSSILRALIALIAGILMIEYREDMVKWLTISLGAVFFLSGVISVVYYFVAKGKVQKAMSEADAETGEAAAAPLHKPTFPIVGIGCVILGIILALMPTTFITYIVYVFAALLILGAIGEYVSLIATNSAVRDFERRTLRAAGVRCGVRYWVIPTLLLLFGIVAIIYPQAIASAPFLFIGIAMIIYAVAVIINAVKFFYMKRNLNKMLQALIESQNGETAAEEIQPDDAADISDSEENAGSSEQTDI